MRNAHLIIVLLFVISFTASYVYSEEPDKTLHTQCLYPVVITEPNPSIYSNYVGSSGSGFIVRSEKVNDNFHNVVLTCGHCMNGELHHFIRTSQYNNWSEFKGWNIHPAISYISSEKYDLGVVLFITQNQMPTVNLQFDENLYIGNTIFRVGCGGKSEPRLDYGKITSVDTPMEESSVLRTSVYTVPGDSGGPLFKNYNVIGLSKGIAAGSGIFPTAYPGISFYIKIDDVKKWSADLNNTIDFIYDKEKPLPKMPFFQLNISNWQSDKIIPENKWSEGF